MRKRLSDITNSHSQPKVSVQDEKRSQSNNLPPEDYIDQLLKVRFYLGLVHFLHFGSLGVYWVGLLRFFPVEPGKRGTNETSRRKTVS